MIDMKRIHRIYFYIVAAILMLIFAFTDLQISLAVVNQKSLFGRFFETFGEAPLFIMFCFSTVFLFIHLKQEKLTRIIIIRILMIPGMIIGGMFTLHQWVRYLTEYITGEKASGPWMVILIIIPVLICIPFAIKVKQENIEKVKRFAVYCIIYFIAAQVISSVIKVPWGRMRYREMIDPHLQFTPWYLPQGITGSRSFPSGHTFNSCGTLILLYLPRLSEKFRGKEKALTIMCILWIVLVALSRVIIGAHFASDVTMGAVLGVTLYTTMNSKHRFID